MPNVAAQIDLLGRHVGGRNGVKGSRRLENSQYSGKIEGKFAIKHAIRRRFNVIDFCNIHSDDSGPGGW
jgi:hypothetical protein